MSHRGDGGGPATQETLLCWTTAQRRSLVSQYGRAAPDVSALRHDRDTSVPPVGYNCITASCVRLPPASIARAAARSAAASTVA